VVSRHHYGTPCTATSLLAVFVRLIDLKIVVTQPGRRVTSDGFGLYLLVCEVDGLQLA
jgi:hypothetical protein